MKSLDLSDNIWLTVSEDGIAIHDPRDPYYRSDAHFIYRRMPTVEADPAEAEAEVLPAYQAAFFVFRAGRQTEDGQVLEATALNIDFPHEAYGLKVLEGTAVYEDGAEELWRIQVDPVNMRFNWVRQPSELGDPLLFRIITARRTNSLQLWHTGCGLQIASEAVPGAAEGMQQRLTASNERELLFYSIHPKNCFRLDVTEGTDLEIEKAEGETHRMPGEPFWEAGETGTRVAPRWEARWKVAPSSLVRLTGSCGLVASAWDFEGRRPLQAADATMDFGPFYARMLLTGWPLNIQHYGDQRLRPRESVISAAGGYDSPASFRELAWACEFLYLVDPESAGALMRGALEDILSQGETRRPNWPGGVLRDEDVALTLLLLGRYMKLGHDSVFVERHMSEWRRLAAHLLNLRRRDEALPIVQETWPAQGIILGKEPYFVALCYAGLRRFADIEARLGEPEYGEIWRAAADAMRRAAMTPYQEGGLWHPENNVFINYLDFRDPGLAHPGPRNWERSDLQQIGAPRKDFALYQTVIPFWLGLVDDEKTIRLAYEWIDDAFTYASGRGGVTFPPNVCRSFVALLDVLVRHRHGIAGTGHLMQLIFDRALDSGIPLTATPYGTYARGGPSLGGGGESAFRHTEAGQFWDNAPFFALVLREHYGLDYDRRGWRIRTPNPLPNYPLSRVTNLCHLYARYSISWQGQGQVRRVTVNGNPQSGSRTLKATAGEYEVVVDLG